MTGGPDFSVDLTAVPEHGLPFDLSASAADLDFGEAGFELPGKLRLAGHLGRVEGGGFRLTGQLEGEIRMECVRCLDSFDWRLAESLDLVFLPAEADSGYHSAPAGSARAGSGGEQGLESDDMNVSFFTGDRLQLAETVWEQSHLALPFQPICSPGCRGLCPGCGRNRNTAPDCRCGESETGGGPLGGLRDLLRSG